MIRRLMGLVAVAAALAAVACTPRVMGDSLVFTTSYPTNYVTGATVQGNIGHDPCQDQAEIVSQAKAQKPDRLVLAYTGNFFSPQVRPAFDWIGVYGVGQRYADCYRAIRAQVPLTTQLIIPKVVAARDMRTDPHGSPILNQYLQTAVQGGRYPGGGIVGPLVNTRWSTALDDRLTPGHVFRYADSGGTLRASDGLHLTTYGDKVYGAVLSQIAAGRA
jgi:hypothetical protein